MHNKVSIKTAFSSLTGISCLLFALAFTIYLPSISGDYTRLDDYLLLHYQEGFLSDWTSLTGAFRRGAFGVHDHFYRPVLLCSFIVNRHLLGAGLPGYHVVNMLLHGSTVVLLFRFLLAMDCDRWRSLWCAVFFAVHPAIVQAVAWIPGRNEELLAIEVLLCLICVIRYQQNSSWAFALAAVLVFLLALFTKETGFLILPAMVVVWLHKAAGRAKWQPLIWLTAGCLLGICIYGWVRAGAHLKDSGFPLMALLKVAAYRWPTLVQYLGKMVLPVNLSVFPLQRDTALLPGALVCLSLLALIFYVGKKRKESGVWAVITFLFLVPLLFIPPNMSIQAFEHRLYVPLLFFIPFTSSLFPVVPLQNRWTKPVPGILCGCFVLLQLNHQRYFNNATVFWAQAAKTAPSSAPAQMFCALYATDTNIARQHIARALELDSTTKYVHYNAGVIYFRLGRQQQARYHLQREIELHGYKGARALLQQINMQHLDTGKRIDTPTTPEQ